ncbi:MAG: ribulokinase, partial [Actinomycetales bacterium]
AAGCYPNVAEAAAAMGRIEAGSFTPDSQRHDAYMRLYVEYVRLHDWFGRGGNEVMRRLAAARREVLSDGHAQS